MGIKLIILFLLGTGSIFSQYKKENSTLNDNYITLKTGKQEHKLWIQNDLIADLNETEIDMKRVNPDAQIVHNFKKIKIWKVTNEPFSKNKFSSKISFDKLEESNYNYVLKDASGNLKVSMGNIIIKFKNDWNEDTVRKWTKSKNLEIIQKSSTSGNSYIIASKAGHESIHLANSLSSDSGIESVNPVWWEQMEKR